jgi:uncharacterized membrane protein YidH (DUF202 family)
MKTITIIGIVLIILGALALAYQGFSYTKTEKIIDLGPIEATTQRKERVPIPPIAGGAAVAAGVILVIAGSKQR